MSILIKSSCIKFYEPPVLEILSILLKKESKKEVSISLRNRRFISSENIFCKKYLRGNDRLRSYLLGKKHSVA